ncbi:hypothetical protein JOF29_002816 [Kribbella aluminosa]|uniref:Uncharacterized protein n=1 Tax=Kribbella aluminosa TaxID=416017 RepID=A0ABS4UJE3_9ACTN|nr:hypothetical protein [Kribbella aluminosa]MBP2351733.1 hypothetical protein [Kribbella aluminosa]
MDVWFGRMADIPGIRFHGSPGIERSRLPEANLKPSTEYGSLHWPISGGMTSASPAQQRSSVDMGSMDPGALVHWVWEGLEVPGQPSDYHFLLQGAVTRLWAARASYPVGLQHVEIFGYTDLALIEAVPQIALVDIARPSQGFLRISSLAILLTLLEQEGAVREAHALSRRAQRFGGEAFLRDDLEAKVAALDGERR